ncbi:YwiC-like family protein [Paractinoplanes brasiliensis]|uniref:YwiC-like protein n=1 Tax=Paractinoplanes brasiliensis TaxID=52695 RepID=A0A4R6JN95_9ACTN|nr:YwiC-like family protein [Actinoplanes brasiliensis]TDO36851.1 YwiC-like protein [Actinoplanes brasiliensis]GID30368.1 membrane protein [Actinoplanes brasiliensis]
MTIPRPTTATALSRRRRTARQYIPPQHGAWAMLLVPWLAGVLAAGFRWAHLPLLGAWLTGYLFTYYALQAIKTRRLSRFRPQLLLYGPIAGGLGVLTVIGHPRVLAYAPAYACLLMINAYYARMRRERAIVNDLVSVVQSCLMVLVAATVTGAALTQSLPALIIVLLYFTGTVLYVKTMIRERNNPAYYRISVIYHVLGFVAAACLGAMPATVFAILLARAAAFPRYRLTPKHVGMMEIGTAVLVLIAAVTV